MFADLQKETLEIQKEYERQKEQNSHQLFTHSPDLSSEAVDKKAKISFKYLQGSIILPNQKENNMINSFIEDTGLFESQTN